MTEELESRYYRFMGFDPDHNRRVRSHYVQYLAEAEPVLEIGPGGGEFLDVLRQSGVRAVGVDNDAGMVEIARSRGHDVVLADGAAYLDDLEEDSFGGVFCAHLLEHLDVADAAKLVERVARVLRAGGVFVAVVPNAASYSVLTRDFWRDPTHVRFYDSALVEFLCATAGLDVVTSGTNPMDDPGAPPGVEAELVIEPFIDPVPDDEDGEIAHLRRALRQTQIALRDIERAHRMLVKTMFEPNEAYVVARRP